MLATHDKTHRRPDTKAIYRTHGMQSRPPANSPGQFQGIGSHTAGLAGFAKQRDHGVPASPLGLDRQTRIAMSS